MKKAVRSQHKRNLYHIFASLLFVLLVAAQLCALWQLPENPSLNATDFMLLSLAIFRLTRLFVYDGVTAFIRDLFYDVSEKRGQLIRTPQEYGLQRMMSDIFGCPWCFSIWGGSVYIWAYLMFPSVMLYVTLILALSAVASVLQILANLLGHKAESAKYENQKHR